ncbi:hypothetical protein C8046_03050 [Serinibacter arcticus]|uniref:Small multidrug efflux protein n=1 Tax=Serinibacter arcticus TaxID=1655435 RepID=A0A2U1ZSC6_9MICO|nr:hypothetical protein [Serinibacter arcticus]PWD49822.1 hypothetical protein C8046_03050 [Serinibacter arcticus]
MQELIETLRTSLDGMPMVLQVIALGLVAAIPFLEGDVAVGIGIVIGVPWVLAALVSFAGTAAVSFAAVALGGRVGRRSRTEDARERKVLGRDQRFGVPVAMIIGGFLLSVPLNAFIMSTAGLDRRTVSVSAVISAAINTIFVALVALGLVTAIL